MRGPESGSRVNCACFKCDLFSICTVKTSSKITRAFCFKKRSSLNLKLKPKQLDVLKAVVQQGDML